jgi:CubicO group peptidase (beta-lactamase class C family)
MDFSLSAKGWYITKLHNSTFKQVVWHAGGFLGAASLLYIFPEQEIVGVVMTNEGYPPGMNDILLDITNKFVSFSK